MGGCRSVAEPAVMDADRTGRPKGASVGDNPLGRGEAHPTRVTIFTRNYN